MLKFDLELVSLQVLIIVTKHVCWESEHVNLAEKVALIFAINPIATLLLNLVLKEFSFKKFGLTPPASFPIAAKTLFLFGSLG